MSLQKLSAPQEDRLEQFRLELAQIIPCVPEHELAREQLRGMNLPDLVQKYLNWKYRFIPPRPRSVQFATDFWSQEALSFESEIYDLANRLRRGEDVTPFLSDRIRSHGFVPSPGKRRRGSLDAQPI